MTDTSVKRPALQTTIDAIRSAVVIPPQAYYVRDNFNAKGENEGTLAILVFAIVCGLQLSTTLLLFGEAYEECLEDTQGEGHCNVRALMDVLIDKPITKLVTIDTAFLTKSDIQALNDIASELLINAAFVFRANINTNNVSLDIREAVNETIALLDAGKLRVAEKIDGEWVTHQWTKKAILLLFRMSENRVIEMGDIRFYDKLRLKFDEYTSPDDFATMGVRVVPNAVARYGAYIAPGAILMPSYVNIGAYIGSGTMVDTWATVGSCAQIGENCHLSGGVGIGGVLEPLQNNPTIIGNNCFIGARSEIVEGVIVEDGCVISMGVYIGQSTKIFNRMTGEITYGRIPAGSVVVSGTLPAADGSHSLDCAVIIKTVDAQTRSKTGINELLRD